MITTHQTFQYGLLSFQDGLAAFVSFDSAAHTAIGCEGTSIDIDIVCRKHTISSYSHRSRCGQIFGMGLTVYRKDARIGDAAAHGSRCVKCQMAAVFYISRDGRCAKRYASALLYVDSLFSPGDFALALECHGASHIDPRLAIDFECTCRDVYSLSSRCTDPGFSAGQIQFISIGCDSHVFHSIDSCASLYLDSRFILGKGVHLILPYMIILVLFVISASYRRSEERLRLFSRRFRRFSTSCKAALAIRLIKCNISGIFSHRGSCQAFRDFHFPRKEFLTIDSIFIVQFFCQCIQNLILYCIRLHVVIIIRPENDF